MGFSDSNSGKTHRALLNRKKKLVFSSDVGAIAKAFGFNPHAVKLVLVRTGILAPLLFRGQYYVRDFDELTVKSLPEPLRLVTLSCNARFGSEWYLGLHTALKLNGLAGVQTQMAAFVIASNQVLPAKRRVDGFVVNFSRIRGVPFSEGVVQRDGLRYSGVTRTVLDFFHLGVKKGDAKYAELVLSEVLDGPFKREFLRVYPDLLRLYSTRVAIGRLVLDQVKGGKRVV